MRFYAVTTSAELILLDTLPNKTGSPTIRQIGNKGRIFSKEELSPPAEGGHFIGLHNNGRFGGALLFKPNPCHNNNFLAMNLHTWAMDTGPIASLFGPKELELATYVSEQGRLRVDDPRWRDQTTVVLKKIGRHHPRIIVSDPMLESYRI